MRKRRTKDRSPILNALLAVVAMLSAFNLWHYTVAFSGTLWAWAAVAGFALALVVSLAVLIHANW
jgi:hypothetical protein